MKRFKLLVIIIAVLATASIVFAQRQSSAAASQTQQNAAPYYTYWCPMMGGNWTSPMSGYSMPGWMRGNTNMPAPGRYGVMGRGMMYGYGPAVNSPAANNPTTQQKPQTNKEQKKTPSEQ
jgi:hypothetical protein